jgi:hypothetical protein
MVKRKQLVVGLVAAGVILVIAAYGLLNARGGAPNRRDTGIDCGRSINVLMNYDPRPPVCLWNAYLSQKAAHADMTNYTVEGDPIEYLASIDASNAIHITVVSRDRYGPRGTFQYSCSGFAWQEAADPSERSYLIATGCAGAPDFVDGSRLFIP